MKIKKDHLKKIIDKQFNIANLDLKYQDVVDDKIPEWYSKYSYSTKDNEKWKKWLIEYLRKELKYTRDRAYVESEWYNLCYGLRIED